MHTLFILSYVCNIAEANLSQVSPSRQHLYKASMFLLDVSDYLFIQPFLHSYVTFSRIPAGIFVALFSLIWTYINTRTFKSSITYDVLCVCEILLWICNKVMLKIHLYTLLQGCYCIL